MWARALRYIPAAPAEVLTEATWSGAWSAWLGVGDATAGRQLDAVGSRVAGTLRGRHRASQPVTWRVARRVRDIVALEAIDERGMVVATLTISCSWWDGLCATELTLEVVGRHAPHRWATERALRRALRGLEQRVTAPVAAFRQRRRTWRLRPAPSCRVASRVPGS